MCCTQAWLRSPFLCCLHRRAPAPALCPWPLPSAPSPPLPSNPPPPFPLQKKMKRTHPTNIRTFQVDVVVVRNFHQRLSQRCVNLCHRAVLFVGEGDVHAAAARGSQGAAAARESRDRGLSWPGRAVRGARLAATTTPTPYSRILAVRAGGSEAPAGLAGGGGRQLPATQPGRAPSGMFAGQRPAQFAHEPGQGAPCAACQSHEPGRGEVCQQRTGAPHRATPPTGMTSLINPRTRMH